MRHPARLKNGPSGEPERPRVVSPHDMAQGSVMGVLTHIPHRKGRARTDEWEVGSSSVTLRYVHSCGEVCACRVHHGFPASVWGGSVTGPLFDTWTGNGPGLSRDVGRRPHQTHAPIMKHDGLACLHTRLTVPHIMASDNGRSARRPASPRPAVAQRRPATFFPCRLRRHSARSKKVPCRRPPRCSGPAGAPPVVSGLTMAIEAKMVAARYSQETGQ